MARGGLQCRVRLVQTRTCLQGMLRQFAAACTFLKADLLVNLQGRDVGLLSAGRSRSCDNGSKAAFDTAGMASGSGERVFTVELLLIDSHELRSGRASHRVREVK